MTLCASFLVSTTGIFAGRCEGDRAGFVRRSGHVFRPNRKDRGEISEILPEPSSTRPWVTNGPTYVFFR